MSDTPRTDAEVVCREVHGEGEFEDGWFVEAEFARTLERENNALREKLRDRSSILSVLIEAICKKKPTE